MARKLVCLLWYILALTAVFIITTSYVSTINHKRGQMTYEPGLASFYKKIVMRDSLHRENIDMQKRLYDLLSVEDVYNEAKSYNGSGSLIANQTNTASRKGEQYYDHRNFRINPYDFKFIETGKNICDVNDVPFLVILCLTKYYDIETRDVIRETWGSVVKTRQWPLVRFQIPSVKLVFLLGDPGDSLVKNTIIKDEKNRFGDIVVGGFLDTYSNLTLKVMMGLKWVNKYCPQTKFVVKVDQDTFLHVVNLINFLSTIQVPIQGVIIGYKNVSPKVLRSGRWGVDKSRFPMNYYPNYTNGNCYVISGNAVGNIFAAAEMMPYIRVEDAFITGIVRNFLGIEIIHHKGFTQWNESPPKLCGFHNDIRIAATNTGDDRKRKLWKALSYRNLKNCYGNR